MALNNIANPDIIYPGQQLIIPAAGEYIPTRRAERLSARRYCGLD